jgi:uncharacterized membrane protein YGL010W
MQYSTKLSRWEKMMVDYGFFHQSAFNLATHFIGVPIIVASVLVPLSWLNFFSIHPGPIDLPVNLALLAAMALGVYYISLDKILGWLSIPILLILWLLAAKTATYGIPASASWAAIGFFGGFALQFIGHGVEGKKPALTAYNPIVAMITSPLFVVAELAVRIGIRKEMFAKVHAEIRQLEPWDARTHN